MGHEPRQRVSRGLLAATSYGQGKRSLLASWGPNGSERSIRSLQPALAMLRANVSAYAAKHKASERVRIDPGNL